MKDENALAPFDSLLGECRGVANRMSLSLFVGGLLRIIVLEEAESMTRTRIGESQKARRQKLAPRVREFYKWLRKKATISRLTCSIHDSWFQ
jgi:hypothetical protein